MNLNWLWLFKAHSKNCIFNKYRNYFNFGVLNFFSLQILSDYEILSLNQMTLAIPNENTDHEILFQVINSEINNCDKKNVIFKLELLNNEIRKPSSLYSISFEKELKQFKEKYTSSWRNDFSFIQIFDENATFELATTPNGLILIHPFMDIWAITKLLSISTSMEIEWQNSQNL